MPYRESAKPLALPQYRHGWWMRAKRAYLKTWVWLCLWSDKMPIWPFTPFEVMRNRHESRHLRHVREFREDLERRVQTNPMPKDLGRYISKFPVSFSQTNFRTSYTKFSKKYTEWKWNVHYDPKMDPRGVPESWLQTKETVVKKKDD